MMFSAGPASAATVSDTTIANAARGAGLAGCGGLSLGGWVAVALAESGGNPTAHASTGEDSRGLWQINMRAHASWVGGANLYDPATNAWAAKHVCDMQGPSAWSVYGNGMYTQYLSRGAAAAAAAVGGDSAAAVPNASASVPAQTPAAQASAPPAVAGNSGSSSGSWDGIYHSLNGYSSSSTCDVQRKLRDVGYSVAVDGDFGWRTAAAVKDYQTRNSLLADGVVGPRTWGRMFG
jgi:hypothetical protein